MGHLRNKPCRGAKRAVGSRHVGGSGVEVHPEWDSVTQGLTGSV